VYFDSIYYFYYTKFILVFSSINKNYIYICFRIYSIQVTETIRNTINRFEAGYVFTSSDFNIDVSKQATVNKVLNNMVAAGQIRRLSKGRFYKPKMSEFGELQPDTFQMVKDLIEKNGKPTGYITGFTIFNKYALTTQVPAALQIGVRKDKKPIVRGAYRIYFVSQPNIITKENIPVLQLLDCLRFFKSIPDTMPDQACRRLIAVFKELDDKQLLSAKKLVLKYNPASIALLGAILENACSGGDISILFKAINHQSTYKLGISEEVLPNGKKWHIL